ncbi:MAG: response regulator transcription factor [Pelatocladus maniniholoensis HA4357-MV3]|uniref:Response regulator transcription factor n=1 Tax=Pelatocladus maniniholoensis HA4357-MV3 TaxID=1117104 RepID=A0A9E3H9H0_9NOST|nr:response regulator transcription factor [Pelatocladus maniniholoensis HA4357-MV3]
MSKIRVVIIEDHELMRFAIVTALSANEQIEVCGEAENGFLGLSLIKKQNPDIALVDINLPDMNGAELCKKIKDTVPVKVIILTADNTQDTVTKAFKCGADSYCIKNLPREKLAEVVHATHRGESWIDSTIGKILIENMRNQTNVDAKNKKFHNKREYICGVNVLSHREIDVLQLIAQGMSNEKIAEHLYISIGTVRSHVHRILQKLSCESRSQAAIKAISEGLVETPGL